MKYTVLDMTQSILSAMDSDEVNSINDTVEASQVAECIRTTYNSMVSRFNLPANNQLIQLTASGSSLQPTLMTLPDGVQRMDWLKYFDTNTGGGVGNYIDLYSLSLYDFITMVSQYNTSESNVGSFTLLQTEFDTGASSSYTFYFKKDSQPRYYTVLSNQSVIFDSYDNTQDTTLQSVKTLASAWLMPSFQKVDGFIPVLDEQQFPLLLQEAKALAFAELKQMPHQKAEIEVRRQTTALQKYKSIVDKPTYFEQLPDFGRKGVGYPRTSRFFYSYGRPNN